MCVEEFTYLRGPHDAAGQGHADQRAAGRGLLRSREIEGAYATRDAYLADLVDFTRREIAELARLGCDYIQIDAPQYAALLDETIREGYRQRGSDPDRLLDTCIELDNAIIDGHPGVTFGIHICRGNHKSMFYACGGYDRIAAQIFQPDPLPALPARVRRRAIGRRSSRCATCPTIASWCSGWSARSRPQLESAAELERRIAEAARYVPLERLALSPQCGFASTQEGNRLTPDDQRRKLELVAATARAVWTPASTR